MSSHRHFQLIDVLKGFAILAVVMGHIIQRTMVVNHEDFFIHPLFKIIYTFHMPVFFILSGYLLAESLIRHSFIDVIIRRLQSIGVPYISWSIFGILTSALLNNSKPIVNQFLLYPSIWFLWVLIIMIGLIISIAVLMKQHLTSALICSVLFVWFIPSTTMLGLHYVKWFYVFVVIGFLIHLNWALIIKVLKLIQSMNIVLKYLGVFLMVVLLSIMLNCVTANDYVYVNHMAANQKGAWATVMSYSFRYMVSIFGICLALIASIGFLRSNLISQWLSQLGKYSLGIYLVQRYVVEGLYEKLYAKVGVKLFVNEFYFNGVYLPILTVMLVMVCYAVTRYFLERISILNKLFLGLR